MAAPTKSRATSSPSGSLACSIINERRSDAMSVAEKIDSELETFRAEARGWLEENFPPSLKGKSAMMASEDGPESGADFAKWKKAMGDKGWGTPTYPKQYGGGGLSTAEARVLQQEMSRIGAFNPIGGMGVMM